MRDDRRGNGSGIPFGGGRHRINGTNGVHPDGLSTTPIPLQEYEEPIDLVAVQADDELVNALRAGMAVSAPGVHGYDADDHVAAILAAWKAEVDAEPIPELVDIDMAMAAIESGRPSTARRTRRHLAPVAAAAAFVVLAIGGVSIGSASSQPGDALWAVSKVLYSQRAQSVEAAARAETRISSAKQALAEGQPVVAAQELQQAQADLASVRPQEGKADLADVQSFLVAKADETPPGQPTDPGTPLKSDRKRKVPRGAGMSESPNPGPSSTGTTSTDTPGTEPSSGGPSGTANPGGGVAPTVSPSPTATNEGRRDRKPTPAPTTATVEGGPSTTTPQGMNGAEGSPASSTTAAGDGSTTPTRVTS